MVHFQRHNILEVISKPEISVWSQQNTLFSCSFLIHFKLPSFWILVNEALGPLRSVPALGLCSRREACTLQPRSDCAAAMRGWMEGVSPQPPEQTSRASVPIGSTLTHVFGISEAGAWGLRGRRCEGVRGIVRFALACCAWVPFVGSPLGFLTV